MSPTADQPAATREPIALVTSLEHGQAPAEHSPQWLPQEDEHAHDQHAEPEMALVIEREIAIAEMPVGRQIEEQQPADAGHEHETRDSPLATPWPRVRLEGSFPASPTAGTRRRGAEQPQHERRRRRGPPGAFPARARTRVRRPAAMEHGRAKRRSPRWRAPARCRPPAGWIGGQAEPGQSRPTSSRPTASRPNAAGRASRRSWMRRPAPGGPRPSASMPARAPRAGGARRTGLWRERIRPAARRRRPALASRDAHRSPRPAAALRSRAPYPGKTPPSDSRLARERALDPFEGAFQGHRARAIRRVEHIPVDEGLQLRFRGFDGIAEHEQIAQTFALLQPKFRQARLRVPERREKRGSSPGASVGQRRRQPGEIAGGFAFAAPAEPLAHDRLRESAMRPAKRAQHGVRQAADRDDRFGETPVATGIVDGNPIEPWQQQADGDDDERRLDHVRPRGSAVAGEAYARLVRDAEGHGLRSAMR